jgi:hypothetical protein
MVAMFGSLLPEKILEYKCCRPSSITLQVPDGLISTSASLQMPLEHSKTRLPRTWREIEQHKVRLGKLEIHSRANATQHDTIHLETLLFDRHLSYAMIHDIHGIRAYIQLGAVRLEHTDEHLAEFPKVTTRVITCDLVHQIKERYI